MANISPPDTQREIVRPNFKMFDLFREWTAKVSAGASVGDWRDVTFENSWVNFGVTFESAQFRTKGADDVELRGTVKDGTLGSGTPIFTLPEGLRPLKTSVATVASGSTTGQLQVRSDGSVVAITGSNTLVSLKNIKISLV